MFGSFIPREGKFFELFRQLGEQIVNGSQEFVKMSEDLAHADRWARSIKDIEHRGDEITHATMDLLHHTFITPLDREDIHTLISRMDDILDFIDAAAQRLVLYKLKELPAEGRELAQITARSAELVRNAVLLLENLKQRDKIREMCVEINRLENEADHALRTGLAKLFDSEPDIRTLIKLKEIYELLETVTDRCEDAANVIDGIVLEYA